MDEKAFFRHSSFNAGGHVQLVSVLLGICKTLSLMAACQVHWSQRREKTQTKLYDSFLATANQSSSTPPALAREPILLLTSAGRSRGCLQRHVGAKLSSVSCLMRAPITAFIMAQPWFPPSLSVPLGEWGSGITHIRVCIINACSGLKSHSNWDTKLAVGCMIQTSRCSGISMQNINTQSQRDLSLTEGQLWKGLSLEHSWLLLSLFSRQPLNVHHVSTASFFYLIFLSPAWNLF